jgi:capsid protein
MLIDTLAPGESIVGVGPDYPVSDMPEYIGDQIRRIASGMGLRYSAVSKRYDASYSAMRQELVDAEGYTRIREDEIVTTLVRPVYERFITAAALDGKLQIGIGRDALRRAMNAQYVGPAIPWIDPAKEVSAAVEAIDNGLVHIDRVRARIGSVEMIGEPAPKPAKPEPAQTELFEEEEDAA